jgi:hypothetical protein
MKQYDLLRKPRHDAEAELKEKQEVRS